MTYYNGNPLILSWQEVARYAGLKVNHQFPRNKIEQACMEAKLLSQPQGKYELFTYNPINNQISEPLIINFQGPSIQKHLQNCQTVALLAVTIGETIETHIKQHFTSGNYTAGLLLDAAATAAVENLADQLNNLIKAVAAKQGLSTTWRFSPGYGDWDVTIQAQLLNALQAESIGLKVTESMMLMPRKSITAVIGFITTPNQSTDKPKPNCPICTNQTCIAREESTT